MILNNRIIKNELFKLCVKHNVKNMFAFGSVLRTDFDLETSDIDLLVDIDYENPIEKGEHLMQL